MPSVGRCTVRASVAAVIVHARRQSPLSDPDNSLFTGKAGQFVLTLGNCHVFDTEVMQDCDIQPKPKQPRSGVKPLDLGWF